MKYCMLIILLSCYQSLRAVDNLRWSDIRSLGMGINGVTQSYIYNPALVASSLQKKISVDYFNRYALKELGTLSAGVLLPNHFLSTGLNISSFGYEDYRETMIRLSVGKRLGNQWFVGISTQYAILQSILYEESPQQLGVDVGILYSPVEKLLVGMLIMNTPSIRLNKQNNENKRLMDYYFQVGFQYQLINSLLIVFSMGSNREHKIIADGGIEYHPFNNFSIRVGICSAPLLPTFGIGYCWHKFKINIAAVHHPALGISSGLGISYNF